MKTIFRLSLIVFFLFLSHSVYAQSDRIIKGIIIDSISGAPESFATAYLFPQAQNSKPLQSTFSDEHGIFQFKPIKPGHYRVLITCIGRKPVNRLVNIASNADNKEERLDTIRLCDAANQIGAVTISAQRPLLKAEVDKISYQISDDPEAQTNSTLEMLRKVPMVTVDGEDNIQVNGSSSFKVYVNGKPNQMMSSNPSEIFKNYPASVIKKIEVITNPGARYDAEGVAGVLNIITEGNARTTGYSITPSFTYNSNGYKASLFGMTQVGKLMLSAHYGIDHHDRPASLSSSRREVFNEMENHLLTSDGRIRRKGNFHFGSLEGSYEFDTHNLLSFSAGIRGMDGTERGLTSYNMFSATSAPVYSYAHNSYAERYNFGINASADYQHSFAKPGRALTISYRMGLNPGHNKAINDYSLIENVPYILSDLYSDTRTHSDEHTIQMDYTTPLDTTQTLSAGLKYIYRINRSDNDEKQRTAGSTDDYTTDPIRSLLYRHHGDILAAYTEYGITCKQLSAKAGLRYEYYNIDVTYPDGKRPDFDKKLGDFVPSVSFGYNLTPTKMLKLGYNMRIGRPGINSLSPYVTHNTPENISYGNPNLTSEHAHNIEAGFSTFSQRFNMSATLTYSVSTDGITNYSFIEDNIINTTSDNFMHRKAWTLNIFLRTNITKTTSINLNSTANYTDYKISQIHTHRSGASLRTFGGIQQKLPLKLRFGIWAGGHTPDITIQGKGAGFYFYALNLSRSFLKDDRLEVTLQANNVIGRYHYFNSSTTTPDYHFTSKNREDFMRLGIGLRYRFGTLKSQANTQVKKAKRTIHNDDATNNNDNNDQQQADGGQ